MIRVQELDALIKKHSPGKWKPFKAFGIVFLANTDEEKREVFRTIQDWAKSGIPLRIPHHTVSAAGLAGKKRPAQIHGSEVELAANGILVLDEFAEFHKPALKLARERIEQDQLPVMVIGLDTLERPSLEQQNDPSGKMFLNRLRAKAKVVGVPVVTMDDLDEMLMGPAPAPAPGEPVDPFGLIAIDFINEHRRSIGQAPLDPEAAGWTSKDLGAEAKRIQRLKGLIHNRARNPSVLKRRLLR